MDPNQESNMQTNNMNQTYSNVGSTNIDTTGQNSMNNGRPSNDVVFQDASDKKNNKIGIILGFVLLVLIAAGGVGFGVWAMMDGDAQIKKLNEQIDDLRQQNSELQEMIDKADSGSNSEKENNSSNVSTDGYININEWGLKIRIPDGLNNVDYKYKIYNGNRESVSFVGVANSEQLYDFANFNKNEYGLGSVTKQPKDLFSGSEYDGVTDDVRACGFDSMLVFTEGDYNYCCSGPQTLYTADSTSSEAGIENASIELIREMLNNPDNYSKI